MDLTGITLASILTIPGALGAALVVTLLTEIIKNAWPTIDARFSGALIATALTVALYAFAYLAVGIHTAEGFFAAFLAWITATLSSIGIHGAAAHIERVSSSGG